MGLAELPTLTRKLVEHGMDEAMPIAVISRASYADQTLVIGILSDIDERVKSEEVSGPTTIILGEVVGMGSTLPKGN